MPRSHLVVLLVFAATLFTSALLLFLVEPMIGKMITPLLGGTPAVWNTCMVFFQAVLLAGYAYAHLSTSWLGARKQAALHLGLLVLPFVFLPLAVNRDLIKGGENPILELLVLLSLSVGVPMFIVSSSAPLLQKWFASTAHPAAKDPYFLYGASNLGSMIALIGYPLVVERYLRLGQQSFDWSIGYGLLVAVMAVCGVFLWLSPRNVETGEKIETKVAEGLSQLSAHSSKAIRASKHDSRADKRPQPTPPVEPAANPALTGEATWPRVLRWVALAFVPSSLMLGATTYITTDIAAIPLLWVTPLALYLLTFIIVFARVPAWVHKAMVLTMPLLVLALLFFILSGLKTQHHWITWSVCMHLGTLFVVSMVCHGELARDRPAAKYLTGYYLWMSVGGVLGGLFNALLAPVIFTGIVEYELVMMLACFLAPPLEAVPTSSLSRRFDIILAGLFAGVGMLLVLLRVRDHNLSYSLLEQGPWMWQLAALLLGIGIGVTVILRARQQQFDRCMDLALPLCLAMLLIGLSWGLWSRSISPGVRKVAETLNLSSLRLRSILTYGVPIVLCYTFVERSLRFALGIGAVLLAAGFCGIFENDLLHQERSFFGVLKVEKEDELDSGDLHFYPIERGDFAYRRLVHGTTLHGKQFVCPEDRRDEPLTYYHRTGPIGEVMMVYNSDDTPVEKMNFAVIGLGTGTMAAYARPGQHLTFYDIDPIVKRLSFDEAQRSGGPFPYFTFVQDARDRGAKLDLVMGDARLTMERQHLKDSDKYGVMVIDAFSSDAIPIHLITLEALDVYLDKLSENGLLCFHISNRHLDLRPVLYNIARERGLAAIYQSDDHDKDPRSTALLGKFSSTWVVLSRSPERLRPLLDLNDWEGEREAIRNQLLRASAWPNNGNGLSSQAMLLSKLFDEALCKRPSQWKPLEPDADWPKLSRVGVWTDDYSNLLSVFWW
ncbi:MAG TPA: hypothetical protein VMG10_12575 [Gemmataceae bacterium]|nr:hypothetical protein [Gemmataceae bacterium]